MNNFKDLNVWKKSMDFVTEIYQQVSLFPEDEKFGLVSQMKRAAISIPSNIAEGSGRNSKKEFIHFLSIAKGSSYELQTQILLSSRLGLLNEVKTEKLNDSICEIQKMIFGLQKHLKSKIDN